MNRISEGLNIVFCMGFVLLIFLPIGEAKGTSDNVSMLLELAMKRSFSLTRAEAKLVQVVEKGELADFSDTNNNNDPNGAEKWGGERVVRADLIAWLCTDPEASAIVTNVGIYVKGARIDGKLDLQFARTLFPLHFWKCAFPEEIVLNNAEIGSLVLDGTYTGPIQAEGLRTEGNIFLRDGFKAKGAVNLAEATIGGNLSCIKGTFVDPNGVKALTIDGSNIKGSVILSGGFQAEGAVSLHRAKIEKFFVWTDVNYPEKTELNLRSASIGILRDDIKSWPSKLVLDGLVYSEIDDRAPLNVMDRIKWLRRQPHFRPQPYEQFAEVLDKSGYEENAVKILIMKERDLARFTRLSWGQMFWYRQLGPLIDYGYRPLKTFNGIIVFIVLGWFIFGIGYRLNLITPQNESAYVRRSISPHDDGVEARELSDIYPRFNFLVYSVDALVPLVDLHQVKYWLPNTKRGLKLLKIKGFSLHIGGLLRLYLWIHLTMGWVLTSVFIMGLTGIIRTKAS